MFEDFEPFDGFQSFDDAAGNTMTVWLDLLGMRNLPHGDLVRHMRTLMEVAGRSSAMKLYDDEEALEVPGTEQMYFQYAIVGDALVMANKPRFMVAGGTQVTVSKSHQVVQAYQHQLLLHALEISKFLFERDLPHRAAITVGKVFCHDERGSRTISGEAVVKAYGIEQRVRTLGLYMDESCRDFITARSSHEALGIRPWSREAAISTGGPIAVLLGDINYKNALRAYCNKNSDHEKSIETLRLLQEFGC